MVKSCKTCGSAKFHTNKGGRRSFNHRAICTHDMEIVISQLPMAANYEQIRRELNPAHGLTIPPSWLDKDGCCPQWKPIDKKVVNATDS